MISFITSVAQKSVLFGHIWSSMTYKALVAHIPMYYVFIIVNDLYKASNVQLFYYLVLMIVNDLLKKLSRPKMFFNWFIWSSMISYKASVAQKCSLFGLHDRQWSSTKPRTSKYAIISFLWSSMISFITSVAQKVSYLALYDRQRSSKKPRSPKYVFYLISIIVNDLLQSLGRPNMFLIWSLWSSMISCKASVAQIFFFIWSLWSSMISYKTLISQNSIKFVSMIVNDLFHILGCLKMYLVWFPRSSMIFYKA